MNYRLTKEINKFEDNMQYSLQFITDNLEQEEHFLPLVLVK